MTMTFGIDPATNDMVIDRSGKLVITTGAQQVAQKIRVALRHYLNEYFLDVNDGVPYYEVLLGSKKRKLWDSILRQHVLAVPGALSVAKQQFNFDNPDREFEYFARVEVEGEAGPTMVDIVLAI